MDLSIVIPSKNEKYLRNTIEDIAKKFSAQTEILWEEDPGIGQRRLTTKLIQRAKGKYIMKCDAHCSFSRNFDSKMLDRIDEKTILAPTLMPLDAETWSINGKKQMNQFVFDTQFVMQHADGEAGETMCLQGSCWMILKENYYNWNLDDIDMPSWGGQGVELGIKAFLNDGCCRTTKDAFYGHVFRLQEGDFPYERGTNPGKYATEVLKRKFKNQSIAGLIERFNYPADWTEAIVASLL